MPYPYYQYILSIKDIYMLFNNFIKLINSKDKSNFISLQPQIRNLHFNYLY